MNLFSDSYHEARTRLLQAAEATPGAAWHGSLPDGVATTELCWIGPEDAANLLVLISATHGVEGFVGAAVQLDLLLRLQQGYSLPANTAILLVFALNPSGFVLRRRCDGEGIDLNRNFVDFSKPLPENPDYPELMAAVRAAPEGERLALLETFRRKWGNQRYEIAFSGGQYVDPEGPFYGGAAPAHGQRVMDELQRRYALAGRHLAVVDIHSGLGPYGYGEVISDHPPQSGGHAVAKRWYGAGVTSPALGESSSVAKSGLLDYWWHGLMQQRGAFVTLEFGSYGTAPLLLVILENHLTWRSGNQARIEQSAAAMQEHFCPHDDYWREMVVVKARQVIRQALDGLSDK